MNMNDNTILRIKVPAHLYEAVKAQLTLNEANLTLNSYAKKLYSLFKKEGATPVLITGKGKAGDLAKSNVAIVVKDGKFDFAPYGYFSVDIKGTKAIAEKYANLVAQTFPDLEKIGNIEIKPGWGGEGGNDTTATVKLRPKTTGGKPEDSFGGKGVGTTKVTETDDMIQEAKGKKMYGAGMEEVKGQKASGTSSDKPKAPKKAPQKGTGAMFDKETEKMGAGVSEAKKMGLEEFKALAELLNNEIMKLEEKEKGAEKKAPVEEKKEADHEQEGQE